MIEFIIIIAVIAIVLIGLAAVVSGRPPAAGRRRSWKVTATLRQVRDTAARIIESNGWFQGGYHGPGGNVCALAALYEACDRLDVEDQVELIKSWKPWTGFNIVAFNDAPGRTKAEVLQLLRDQGR